MYCATCRAANDQSLLNAKPTKSTPIHDGFMNWKKALKTFCKYEHSNMDKEATIKLASKARGAGIDAQLSDDQKHHRFMFMKLLHASHVKDCLFAATKIFSGDLY